MTYKTLPLPGGTTSFEGCPQLIVAGGGNTSLSITLRYSAAYVTEEETILRGEILFLDVLEFRWIDSDVLYEAHAQHEADYAFGLIEIEHSAYVETMAVRGPWRDHAGARIRGRPESEVRHFRMGFDEWGTLDVIATEVVMSSKMVPYAPSHDDTSVYPTRAPGETLYAYLARLRLQPVRGVRATPLIRDAVRSPDELFLALRNALHAGDSPLLRFILDASYDLADRSLLSVLCEIVDSHDAQWGVESAVGLLGKIEDPAAVPSLTRLLRSPPAWDATGHVGERAILSLERIGTPLALDAIRHATADPRRRVWEMTITPMIEHDRPRVVALARRLLAADPGAYRLDSVLAILVELDTPDAWQVIAEAAACDDEDTRALGARLLRERRPG